MYSPWEIAKGYLQTWFLLDLAASFPIDWIMNTIGKQSDAANGAVLLRMLKLGKLLRLVRIIRMGRSEAMEEEDDDNDSFKRSLQEVVSRGRSAAVRSSVLGLS